MKKTKLLFSLVTLLLSFLLQAQRQEIKGKLIANDDVEGIHILNKTASKYTVSDDIGLFSIEAKANDTLFISSLIYNNKEIVISKEHENSNSIEMKIDPVVAKYCEEFIDTHPKMTLLDLTQVLMLQSGKFLMKPVINKSNSDFQMKINSKDTQEKDWDKSIENWLIS